MSGMRVLLQKNCFSTSYDLMFTTTDAPNTIIPDSLAVRPGMEPYIPQYPFSRTASMDSICSTHRVLPVYDLFVYGMKCEDSPWATETCYSSFLESLLLLTGHRRELVD